MVCDLHALSVIEEDKAWFIEHRFLSTERAKAVTRGINERPRTCATPRCCIPSTSARPTRLRCPRSRGAPVDQGQPGASGRVSPGAIGLLAR